VDALFFAILDALQSNQSDLPEKQLLCLLRALSLFVTSIDHKVQPLMNAILKIDWLNRDQHFIDNYLHLLQNIVSAQSEFVIPICKMLLQNIISGNLSLIKAQRNIQIFRH
jgi:hypothetical protein